MSGHIEILIGPNGYGKTTYLNKKLEKLSKAGETCISLGAEILPSDDVKGSKDSSWAIRNIVPTLIETKDYNEKIELLKTSINKNVDANINPLNELLNEVLEINDCTRTTDAITSTNKLKITKQINISDELQDLIGDGQRMQFLLGIIRLSNNENIFIDEPEKYSHPSMINRTANQINKLINEGRNVYLATHSPKLISMLNVSLNDIFIINDSSHKLKKIKYQTAIDNAIAAGVKKENLPKIYSKYYNSEFQLLTLLRERYNEKYIEALFSKNVIICEGINDYLYVKKAIEMYGYNEKDYCIFQAWGKFCIPIFISLFKQIEINCIVLYDHDDTSKPKHKISNKAINNLKPNFKHCFKPKLEDDIGFNGDKEQTLEFIEFLDKLGKKKFIDLKIH